MNLTLIRHAYLPDCVLGRLYVGPQIFATLEEAWTPNPDGPGGQKRALGKTESCIGDGTYTVRPHVSTRYPDGVWAVVNTAAGVWYMPGDIPAGQKWGRSAILIHSGNTTDDIEGCVLVGLRHGRIDGRNAVLESRNAVALLRGFLQLDYHTLTIRPTAGTKEPA